MGEEIFFGIGALVLPTALIYGTLHVRYRRKYQSKIADQVVRDRYEHNRT